jgi:hypothetical protein
MVGSKFNGNIMRKERYSTETLLKLFHQHKVLTLEKMKEALGTDVKMTVFRKLRTLPYRASYSHAGKYYTLDDIADYSREGLWSFGDIHFSRYGSLKKTVEAFVHSSEAGYSASELQKLLHVRVHKPLSELCSSGRLLRQQIGGEYLYFSPVNQELQLRNRKERLDAAVLQKAETALPEFASPKVQNALHVFLSHLNEKQRRLYVGLESMKFGYGGDTLLAKITGMNVKTIARGRKELLSHEITPARIRKAGGGRIPLEKKPKS